MRNQKTFVKVSSREVSPKMKSLDKKNSPEIISTRLNSPGQSAPEKIPNENSQHENNPISAHMTHFHCGTQS